MTDKEKELKKWARKIKAYCDKTECKDCCFFKKTTNPYDYCNIGYGNNGAVPRNWF